MDKLYSRIKFVEENFKKKVETTVTYDIHTEAMRRRERVHPPPLPTKQLPRRERGHYGERNWYELPDRFEMVDISRRRATSKKAMDD
jgi:hypothetical protein